MASVRAAVVLVLMRLLALLDQATGTIRTFGSTPDQMMTIQGGPAVCAGRSTTFLNHTLSRSPSFGVVNQFWTVQAPDVTLAEDGVRLEFSYYFDGEVKPSVVFEPALASGQGWAAARLGGRWVDSQRFAGDNGVFAAGGKMGKSATEGGWWHKFKMPFERSVLVTATLVPRGGDTGRNITGVCHGTLAIVRGFEDTSPSAALTLPSGVTLPRSARMVLHSLDSAVGAYEFAPLAVVPAGVEGLLFQTAIALEVSPPWSVMDNGRFRTTNEYIEGCWHLQRTATEALPAQPVGTGFEDFFDSGYGFSIIGPDPKNASDPKYGDTPGSSVIQRVCNGTVNPVTQPAGVCEKQGTWFNHATSGLLHFSSDSSADAIVSSAAMNRSALGVERISAYRFMDEEALVFEDGGALRWRNSDNNPKCHAITDQPRGVSYTTLVRSYTWVYEWPKEACD
jgi:hypothetical protein